ncbi:hypothetical protein [Massilia sp. PWRC2]|uniref:hypothetical protein n=1 Tax=Massilia sp. PWRC2 TaxID=2804626 RepID=UPI003CE7275E
MNATNNISVTNASQQNITVTTPHGTLHIKSALDAEDHAMMKATELHAFLALVSGEGQADFMSMNEELKNSLLWAARRSAGELCEVLAQVRFAEAGVSK